MVWAGRAISLLRFVKGEAKLGTVWLLRVQEQIMCLDRVSALETIKNDTLVGHEKVEDAWTRTKIQTETKIEECERVCGTRFSQGVVVSTF